MSSPDEATGLALAFGQLVGNKYQVALVFAIINIRSTMGLGLIAAGTSEKVTGWRNRG